MANDNALRPQSWNTYVGQEKLKTRLQVSIDGALNREDALEGLAYAKKYSNRVIVEKFITGYDFRILVINNRFIAAALREPAHVIGDGVSTIQQLIDIENKDPRRGYGHENVLTEISIDRETDEQLTKHNYTLSTVLKKDEQCYLKGTANLSTGGTSTDVTDIVHPHNIFICERISRVIGLDICGIDIMATNLSEPLEVTGGVVLEVNAAPGFRMHLAPANGLPRNVAAPVIDMLYPTGKSCRIPIIAVTGTNGKTTTTRLIAHIVKNNGFRVGFTTSDGIYVQNSMLTKGDTTGPVSAEFILKDPTVEFAVLETARGGILRSGLGFGKCDVAVVTNIQEDHMGLSDINTLKDMANVKGVVARAVKRDGYAVLNADNEHCVSISKTTDCKIAYFSLDENNPVILEHCKKNGIAAIYENGYITIKKGDWKFRVEKASHVPLTFGGKVTFNIYNVLAATLASYVYGFTIEDIKIEKDSISVTIKNKRNITTPVAIYAIKNKEIKKQKWVTDITDSKKIQFKKEDYDAFVLNYENLYPELNVLDNWRQIDRKILNKPVKFSFIKDISDPNFNQLFYQPDVRYNYYNGVTLGLKFHNKPFIKRNFEFNLSPYYGIKSNTVLGHFSLLYNQFFEKTKIYSISYGLVGNTLDYAPNLSYSSLIPHFKILFKRKTLRDATTESVIAKLVHINKEVAPNSIKTSQDNYSVLSLSYNYVNPDIVKELRYRFSAEFAKKFSKATVDLRFRRLTSSNTQLDFRLFAGAFLNNKTTGDYFSFGLDRSNDYLFQLNYFGRSESKGLLSQQYVISEGGFKSVLPTRFANQYMVATNSSISLWKWIELYGDVAFLKNRNKAMYFAHENGIRFNFIHQIFEIYFPLHSNNGWELSQKKYPQKNVNIMTTTEKDISEQIKLIL